MRFPVQCPSCNRSDAEARWVTNDFRCRQCSHVFFFDRSPYPEGGVFDFIFKRFVEGATVMQVYRAALKFENQPYSEKFLYPVISKVFRDIREAGFRTEGEGTKIRKVFLDRSARDYIESARRGSKWKSRTKFSFSV
jgi:hypothetical protein